MKPQSRIPVLGGESPRGDRAQAPLWLALLAPGLLFGLLGILAAVTDTWRDDEAFSYRMAQVGLRRMLAATIADVHPPLFYLQLLAWHHFWPAPAAMQVMTLLTSLVTLGLVAAAGGLLRGRRMALSVALLWATFPMFVHYSQDARMYPLALMLEMLAVVGWLLAARRPRLGWILFVAGLTGALYTQNLCLVFAAALLGGETLRLLHARFTSGPRVMRQKGSLAWILSAALAVGLLYAPWLPFFYRQLHYPGLSFMYKAPTWTEILVAFFYYSYTLFFVGPWQLWAWLPGLALLGLLPLRYHLRRGPAPPGPGRPVGMLTWLGAGPFVFLVLYSMHRRAVFGAQTHGVLFMPLLLFPTAAWFSQWARVSRRGRAAFLVTLAICGLFTVLAVNHPRDFDRRSIADKLLELSPPGEPIFVYPRVSSAARLMWQPLPLYAYDDGHYPNPINHCTLIVNAGGGADREEVLNQAKLMVAQASLVKPIYASYGLSAYVLRGLPGGALSALLQKIPGLGAEMVAQQAGPWAPAKPWWAGQLAGFCRPSGSVYSFTAETPDWRGLRLDAEKTSIDMPLPADGGQGFRAILAGGRYLSNGTDIELKTQLAGAPEDSQTLKRSNFVIVRLVDAQAPTARLTLTIPRDLARAPFTLPGEAPKVVYLMWGGVVTLDPARFRLPGQPGRWFDVGSLGDDLYLRSGFHEAEGMPPSMVRWTAQRFELEVPVWPDDRFQEVVLHGYYPAAIKDRRVRLRAQNDAAPGTVLSAERRIETAQWGDYALRLPQALPRGRCRLSFELGGTWSPKASGQGEDPRKLGFYLDAVQLR